MPTCPQMSKFRGSTFRQSNVAEATLRGTLMSMDRSLKAGSGLVRHRNVLTRGERIAQLKSEGKWEEGKPVTGLVKVGHRKMVIGGKAEKKDATADAAAPAAKGAKGAKGAAAAPAAKGAKGAAAPAAKGAKGAAAPAAKGAKK